MLSIQTQSPDTLGLNALHLAATLGFVDIGKRLLDADRNCVDSVESKVMNVSLPFTVIDPLCVTHHHMFTQGGCTALILAAGNGKPQFVQLLVDRGADLDKKTKVGDATLDPRSGGGGGVTSIGSLILIFLNSFKCTYCFIVRS